MKRLTDVSLGKLTAVFTLAGVGIVLLANGQQMFSPGTLNAQSRKGLVLGGVASHAAIGGNCAACHVAPWSGEVMANRCLDCHTDVRAQIDARRTLHGKIADGMQCRVCHTEHYGPHGALTSFAEFDHGWTGFTLTGKHRAVACASCHVNNVYQGTPQTCASCHAEPQVHKGRFGTNCAHCHATSTWKDATFSHTFPIAHGNGKKANACVTCHADSHHFETYTCQTCHRHEPAKTEKKHLQKGILSVENCAKCHPKGRKQSRLKAQQDGPGLDLCRNGPGFCELMLRGWDDLEAPIPNSLLAELERALETAATR